MIKMNLKARNLLAEWIEKEGMHNYTVEDLGWGFKSFAQFCINKFEKKAG